MKSIPNTTINIPSFQKCARGVISNHYRILKIRSIDKFVFIFAKNIYIKTQFETLHKEMIQLQTL
jgi:hypothetical protein